MGDSRLLVLGADTLDGVAARGVSVPRYDRSKLEARLVHIGVGGFHRAHLALYTHHLATNASTWGIVGLGLLPRDAAIAGALAKQDHLYTLIEKGNGTPCPQIVGSIIGFVHAPDPDAPEAANDLIASPSTAVVSLTITEAGYREPSVEQLASGQRTTFDRLVAALAVRRARDAGPVTILSCDNLPGNGTAARVATHSAAARGGDELHEWVCANCTFPNSMVDRITPMTSDVDRAWLRDTCGIHDEWPVVAEPFRQWVLEDDFAAGRPRWEDDGALFTSRVRDWELYKLRLLNAGHSSIAYLCALAGIKYVDEAMRVPEVRSYLERLLRTEAAPTLTEIAGHPREDYVVSVLERFSNTGVRDQIERLCIDGSAKFPTFLLPTIVRQLELGGPIGRASAALAGWARYLGVVPHADQSFDASAERAREHATRALTDPVRFLDYAEVFPAELRESERFRKSFVEAYHRTADEGPIASMTMHL